MYGSHWRSLASWLLVASLSLHVAGQNGTTPTASLASSAAPAAPTDCRCGFQDPLTGNIFTDSIITYFNETTNFPDDVFSVDHFQHSHETGFSIYYREGALAKNVYFTEGEEWNLSPGWLNMNVSGVTSEQIVNGAQISSLRRDIQYGTFRVFMRSPQPWAGGTALTMRLQYNETCSAELDLMNMDDSTDEANVRTATGDQIAAAVQTTNYTTLEEPYYNMGPWDFWEWRLDWTKDWLTWYDTPGQNGTYLQSRQIPTSNSSLVDIPTTFYLKHWSIGDPTYMQGPPTADSAASIGWVRMFFNSSIEGKSVANASGCDASQYCSTDDGTLRVTTSFTEASTVWWVPETDTKHHNDHPAAIGLCAASLAFSAALIAHALLRKGSDERRGKKSAHGFPQRPKVARSPWPSTDVLMKDGRVVSQAWTSQADLELHDMKPGFGGISTTTLLESEIGRPQPPFLAAHARSMSDRPLLAHGQSTAASSITALNAGATPLELPTSSSSYFGNHPSSLDIDAIMPIQPISATRQETSTPALTTPSTPATGFTFGDLPQTHATAPPNAAPTPVPEGTVAAAALAAKSAGTPAGAPQARTRIDYLAGLVAICSLLVSCTHFILTFSVSVIEEYRPSHYRSEFWARRTIGPFFFNEIWVGLFLTTSTRFLTSGFLRSGNLKIIAEKVVCRTPRLMIPIGAVIMLEYFLMDLGAVHFLQYIPSITWTDWTATTVYPNFGWFFNETLQLIYLIPNAAPQIIGNYCMGVLWTIPVQLQFSWLVLLGAVVVREIKTPWKRCGYYAFCIINNWYALSWGSYFWFGLLLADLDITYKYRKYIRSRAWLHYPLLTLVSFLVFLSLANDLIAIWTGWTFSTEERGIHPEQVTGLPIAQTSSAGYPEYIEPKLNGMIFAVGSQYIVELSTSVQWLLSRRVFLWLFPHVFTIYLIHGLVFWSMGSLVCVKLAEHNLPYWANILVTAIVCYTTLFAILPIVTPVMEMLGKEITRNIWVSASEEPAQWRPACWPFTLEEIRRSVHRRDDEPEGKGKGNAKRVGTGLSMATMGSSSGIGEQDAHLRNR